jgi:CAAX protease family protein
MWLWLELIVLYVLVPPLIAGLTQPALGDGVLRRLGIENVSFETGLPGGLFIFPLLLFTFVSMFVFLRLDPKFDNTGLWGLQGFKQEIRRVLRIFALGAPLILLVTWILVRYTELLPSNGFMRLPRELPIIMVIITVFYPWISAFPQEVTHRAFFFHRYKSILGDGYMIFVCNVIAFSWLHAPMWNWFALAMTIPAGILFAWTYRRSNSTLAAGFEHALYGVWVFFTGLGYFVFTGNASGM